MTDAFGSRYADAYDPLYADKDYAAECDLVQSLAARFGSPAGKMLDLGCGTGRHAVLFGARGWRVTGVDRSAEMLAIARRRATEVGSRSVHFESGDIRSVRLDGRFDVALLMFAVLGYQLADADVAATLATAGAHLRPGGLLFFDVWNGSAVEEIGPSLRTKTVAHGANRIRRRALGVLDRARHQCTVDYDIEWLVGETVTDSAHEQHTVRYFFEAELRHLLAAAGLEIVTSGAFPDFDRPISNSEWNALYVARLMAPGQEAP